MNRIYAAALAVLALALSAPAQTQVWTKTVQRYSGGTNDYVLMDRAQLVTSNDLATSGADLTRSGTGSVVRGIQGRPVPAPTPADDGKTYFWNAASNVWVLQSSGGGTTTASTVYYANPSYSNVQQALDALFYVSPSVSLTGGGSYEQGQVATNVALSWTVNKAMATRDLSAPVPVPDRARGPGGNGSYTQVGANIAVNTTYVITVGDGAGLAASGTTLSFYWRRYYGTATNVSGITDAQVKALGASELAASRALDTYVSATNRYVYVAYPAAWGTATFKLYDLPSTGWQLETRSFTNDWGSSASYNIYRSQYVQTSDGIHLEVF